MMRLNILNNYKTIYYNFLASFYLCLNSVMPYYDDVIISIQSQAIKLLIDNNTLNMKKIKKIRMIEFIDSLDKSDKILFDKEKDLIIIDYHIYESLPDTDEAEADVEADTIQDTTDIAYTTDNDCDIVGCDSDDSEKYLYEPCKKKSRIDNNYKAHPEGPIKDIEDSGDVDDAIDASDAYGYELDNEIDMSIRNYIQSIVYDKNKDKED